MQVTGLIESPTMLDVFDRMKSEVDDKLPLDKSQTAFKDASEAASSFPGLSMSV
jgi:hypothetical protein